MKSVCLNFQIHQPFRYRKYRFFDIGNDAYYYDDFANETFMRAFPPPDRKKTETDLFAGL